MYVALRAKRKEENCLPLGNDIETNSEKTHQRQLQIKYGNKKQMEHFQMKLVEWFMASCCMPSLIKRKETYATLHE